MRWTEKNPSKDASFKRAYSTWFAFYCKFQVPVNGFCFPSPLAFDPRRLGIVFVILKKNRERNRPPHRFTASFYSLIQGHALCFSSWALSASCGYRGAIIPRKKV